MNTSRLRRSAGLALTTATLGAVLAPGAALADGPGYGGTADALTVQWQSPSSAAASPSAASTPSSAELAVYAVGFRGGSSVQVQLGSLADRVVTADVSGALRILVVSATTAAAAPAADTTVVDVAAAAADGFSAGTSILVTGETPAGSLRRLVGSVPPIATATGVSDLVPWAAAVIALAAGAVWLGRLPLAATLGMEKPGRHRPGRHRLA